MRAGEAEVHGDREKVGQRGRKTDEVGKWSLRKQRQVDTHMK